ncbi:hypothetical protein MPH_11908 [Macrophomina phaseolina MS6]|uniref:Uncharacterized protein n=1 Tax=Macrophomina phaseolina (strain MS6) TaxID=1126212 RepID=K2QLY4_MACPH|nr:hypothetical protein MPH_11908 [Macrophomina phaseolina MS6]
MLKQTSFAILTFALSCPTTYSLDQPKLQRRDKWSACITDNRGCCDIYELIQRCWDTGVPSGNLDPNDHDVSNNFRTCFCGDTKTNSEDSWSACGHCIMEQWQENGFVTAENANILNFCATPDPNLYLWLTGFLNFTLTANPDALTPNHSPAAVLSGPVTAVATLASRYVQDPSANLIPASIFSLTTETLSFDPSSAHTTTYTVSSASHFHHTMTNSTPQAAAGLTKTTTTTTTTTTTSSGVTTDTSEGQVNDAILTVLYYKDAHTSMFIVGPASEVGSMLTLTRTDTGMATAPTGDTGWGGVTTASQQNEGPYLLYVPVSSHELRLQE